MSDFLPYQHKPKKSLNYQERVKAGLQRGGLAKFSKKGAARNAKERQAHNNNIAAGNVFCVKCGGTNHIEKHHPFGRSQPDEFIYVCGEFGCQFHKWIHQNMDEAYNLGWIQPEYRGLPHNPDWPTPWK